MPAIGTSERTNGIPVSPVSGEVANRKYFGRFVSLEAFRRVSARGFVGVRRSGSTVPYIYVNYFSDVNIITSFRRFK